MTKRLFQALMLTAVLGLVSPAAATATTITLNFDTTAGGNTDTAKFDDYDTFAEYFFFRLTFDDVDAAFSLDVTADVYTNQVALPPGYTCVPINGGTNCILFTVNNITPLTTSGQTFTGDYRLDIHWNGDTNSSYPNGPVIPNVLGAIRILHYDSSGTTDITLGGSYCITCGVDPGIGGQDNNFSEFVVARFAPVPEPGSLILLGSGFVGLAMHLRRRRLKAKQA